MTTYPRMGPGPFRAHMLRDGDEYELSDGHAIRLRPNGRRHGQAQLVGGGVLASDPAAHGRVGVEVGVAWNDDKNLRAPDVIVADVERTPGWLRSIPPLAVEYADTDTDEDALSEKVADLLLAGTRFVWVVRLTGPLRVEVHTRGEAMRTVGADGELVAPGVLKNPVPVRALVDPDAADATSLRNLLSAHGYDSIAQIKAEGRSEGRAEAKAEAIMMVLAARGIIPSAEQSEQIEGCRDLPLLDRWLGRAATAATVAELLA